MSEIHVKLIQSQKLEECEKDIDSDVADDENDDEGKFDNYNGSGRTVTLQMLLSANVLQPGKSAMTIEYLGQKFVGDLLTDGKIKSQETETVFLSPSAWAMHCKRIINPEKKSGCGWASVKYKGKKLDAYKASWMRKCAQQKDVTQDYDESYADSEKKNEPESPVIKRTIVPHNSISNRNIMHDANTLVETVPFLSINKMQPFLVTISSNALLLAEFHSHLTFQEVCGYFGGTWDVNTHSLVIVKTYPCKNTKYDREKAPERESQIQQQITKDQLVVVGWYHSHPKFQSQPTLRDCDTQLDYQIKMRGPSDLTYTPCVGLIFSPYYDEDDETHSPNTAFWIIPPAENRQTLEYGRPMLMQYDIHAENKISDNIKQEMESCVAYYTKFRNELIDFSTLYRDDVTFIEKLRYTLYSKFPQNKGDQEFWNWLSILLKCNEIDSLSVSGRKLENKEFKNPIKKNIKIIDHLTESLDIDLKSTTPELKILSLQEQLCLPSGLNMNPSKLCPPLPTQNITITNNPVLSSPSDSPITIPSSSASPAKFEIPVRASPSPAKSDTSSTRTRNSPAPSPGKFNINDMSVRNSPSVTPNKFENNLIAAFNIQNTEALNSDLMSSNLVASLTSQISSHVLPNDVSVLFQKEYGNSSLKQLAETAAKVGGGNTPIGNKDLFDKRNSEFPFSIVSNNAVQKTQDHPKVTTKLNQDSHKLLKSPSSNSSYKTKLMKELDDLKNDPLKISELMRSPEYAALLLQQAEALGATTLGTLGFGSDFPFMGSGSNLKNKNNIPDYTNMLHASKILGYDQFTQQSKNHADFNQLFQQHVGNSGVPSSKKYPKQTKQSDYTTLLQTYSKYFDAENFYNPNKSSSNIGSHELSALLHSSLTGNLGNSKPLESNSEVLNNFLQSEKNLTELNNLIFHQNKNSPDFSSLFASPVSNTLTSPSMKTLSGDASTYYSTKPEKIQEYSSVYQQNHGKLSIPDPLSKSTLAANNMFMSPSTLLKLHQESLMMKPPKTSPGIVPKIRDSPLNIVPTVLPPHERLTPTKSFRDNVQIPGPKYNFSAADLAVSSVSQSPSPINNCPSKTPPVDLSRIYPIEPPRKRMEFSSIADLAAPPPVKVTKLNERDGILNLSANE